MLFTDTEERKVRLELACAIHILHIQLLRGQRPDFRSETGGFVGAAILSLQ